MKLENIGFYTLNDDRVKQVSIGSPLWRCELLLTDHCNFNCPYCKGKDKQDKENINRHQAHDIIEYWCSQGLKNIRFSGGEPTFYFGIPKCIEQARDGGVERIAISTNGSANLDIYEWLIDLGVNDLSISLDACCSAYGETMCGGVQGAWEKVVSNIRALATQTYITVGMVFTEQNIDQAKESIEFAHELGVADIRVISAAQFNHTIDALSDISEDILNAHPILKYRVNNFRANRPMRGISDNDAHNCALVIDDMAVYKGEHYPCIIYLREGGAPIGKINSERVREERFEWFQSHSTIDDPICSKNCLDVCVDYNNRYIQTRKV